MLILYVHNISGNNDVADYDYIVAINDEIIAEGEVKGHRRSDGWRKLIKMIGEEREAE